MIKISKKLAALAAATLIGLPAAASAQGDDILVTRSLEQVRAAEVRFGDLDLGNSADVERLRVRLRVAANRVCPVDTYLDLDAVRSVNACRSASFQRASGQMDRLMALRSQGQTMAATASITVMAR